MDATIVSVIGHDNLIVGASVGEVAQTLMATSSEFFGRNLGMIGDTLVPFAYGGTFDY